MIEIKTSNGTTKTVMDGDMPSLLADCVMIVKELIKQIDELDIGFAGKEIFNQYIMKEVDKISDK